MSISVHAWMKRSRQEGALDRDNAGRRARYGGWQVPAVERCALGMRRWYDCCHDNEYRQHHHCGLCTGDRSDGSDLTSLDTPYVMQAVREEAGNEQETLVTVVHLMTSGQVRLSADAPRPSGSCRQPRTWPRKAVEGAFPCRHHPGQ